MLWGDSWGCPWGSDVISIELTRLRLVLPELHPPDHIQTVGGFRTLREIQSDVDFVFQPGVIFPSDFSDDCYFQYRKVFIYNDSNDFLKNPKIYGFNLKNNNIVRLALESNLSDLPVLDGSEVTANYLTAPSLHGLYDFVEVASDAPVTFGSEVPSGDKLMPPRSAQGVWLRMRICKTDSQDPTDCFNINVTHEF